MPDIFIVGSARRSKKLPGWVPVVTVFDGRRRIWSRSFDVAFVHRADAKDYAESEAVLMRLPPLPPLSA